MRTLILGTNLRGLAQATRISLDDGAQVRVYDAETADPPADLKGRVEVLPTEWNPTYLDGVDRVITSPWFREVEPPIADAIAAGIDVITEAGFALEHLETPFVAITGTNGKTTVTEVVTEMLLASDVHAAGVGNVGTPVSAVHDDDADMLVIELSSYQLRFLGGAVPMAAALLNIAPDHLDWHGTFPAYAAAKARIFERMSSGAVLAFNVDDTNVTAAVTSASCTLVPCSGTHVPPNGNGVTNSVIVINGHSFPAPVDDPSFLFDLVAAGTVAMAAGASVDGIGTAIASFVPGAHRRQLVDSDDGIRWIDDSKATNPHAAAAAVAALGPVILLAGGQNKGLDLSPLATLDGVDGLIAFGESGPDIARHNASRVMVVDTLGDAVEAARAVAVAGDTVLLSPGCASFDEFMSYAERGDEFQRMVNQPKGSAA